MTTSVLSVYGHTCEDCILVVNGCSLYKKEIYVFAGDN